MRKFSGIKKIPTHIGAIKKKTRRMQEKKNTPAQKENFEKEYLTTEKETCYNSFT